MTPSLAELLECSAARHKHLCPRQVLGVRMGLLAAQLMQLSLPQSNKRLITIVETDGCFADGIAVATGCELGHRTLRLVDFGKVAVTFIDTVTENAFRISMCCESREHAAALKNHNASRWQAYLDAYKVMPADKLFVVKPVKLLFSVAHLVSKPTHRVVCAECREEIFNQREIVVEDRVLCAACAGKTYYASEAQLAAGAFPPAIVGVP